MTELTPDVLAKIRDILSPSTAKTKRATHVSSISVVDRMYYYVEFRGFATVVSSVDCQRIDNAFYYAMHEKLQPWYVVDQSELHIDAIHAGFIKEWTHNDFCDWLRRRE